MPEFPFPPAWVLERLKKGTVIPAHPLALTADRKLDERRQSALTRYYHAAGAGGVAVGVHTTQFEIREPQHNLLRPVLQLASDTIARCDQDTGRRTIRIAGVCGQTDQAIEEARLASALGYHVGLLSLSAFRDASDETLIAHCHTIAREIPLMGFYLQPSVGGRLLSVSFWRQFAQIPNVVGIKMAPFNRYQTFDVIRGVVESGRAGEIALYTGNDDHIVQDLLTDYVIPFDGREVRAQIVGGLLGHWACWTKKAVELLERCHAVKASGSVSLEMLTLAEQVTDANAAFFDAANRFAGCIPGIHEILRRQGLLENVRCLNPHEVLSPGQSEEIDRVCKSYPQLNDDAFVQEHLAEWMDRN